MSRRRNRRAVLITPIAIVALSAILLPAAPARGITLLSAPYDVEAGGCVIRSLEIGVTPAAALPGDSAGQADSAASSPLLAAEPTLRLEPAPPRLERFRLERSRGIDLSSAPRLLTRAEPDGQGLALHLAPRVELGLIGRDAGDDLARRLERDRALREARLPAIQARLTLRF